MFFINKGYPTLIVRNRRYNELEKLKPNPGSKNPRKEWYTWQTTKQTKQLTRKENTN